MRPTPSTDDLPSAVLLTPNHGSALLPFTWDSASGRIVCTEHKCARAMNVAGGGWRHGVLGSVTSLENHRMMRFHHLIFWGR